MLSKPQRRITAIYLVVASLWILLTDSGLYLFGLELSLIPSLSILKGLAYVFVTAALLFFLIRREFSYRLRLEGKLREHVQRLQHAQAALKESERRFRKAVEEGPVPIIIFAEDGEVVHISQSWLEITGYAADQIKTLDMWTALAYGEGQKPIRAHIDRLFALTHRVDEGDFVVKCRDGNKRIWKFSSTPLGRLPDQRRIMMSIGTDITDRVEAERQLRIKDRAIASSITPIALAGLDGRLVYVNRAMLKLWKLDDESQALGRHAAEFWASREAALAIVKAIYEQDSYIGEMTARLSDGSVADIELSASLVRDEKGTPICLMGSFNDITKQKQAEAFALENERLRARFQKEQERNALVQKIISTLSHDLRNSLTVISAASEMLSQYFEKLTPERRLEKLDVIQHQIKFGIELLEDTVRMARGSIVGESFRAVPVNIASLCRVSVSEVHAAKHATGRLRFINHSGIETVAVDEVLVSRILLNLLSNALKYSPEDSEVRLELDQQQQWLILRVVDQGVGISEADLPYIFEPHYRAKNVGAVQGTGLGLSIVKDCVDRHQGRIHVESRLAQGSTFTVELPFETAEQAMPIGIGG